MSEPITPTIAELEACRTSCKGRGWLNTNTDQPTPCLVHKPWLRHGAMWTNDSDPKSRYKPMTAAPAAIVPPTHNEEARR